MARRVWYCEDVLAGNLDVRRVYENELVLAFHHPRHVIGPGAGADWPEPNKNERAGSFAMFQENPVGCVTLH